MFYISWAVKNLARNKKRTLGMGFFIVIIAAILFLNFAFLAGTQQQMNETLRKFVGDINLSALSESCNLAGIRDDLGRGSYKDEFEMVVSEYSINNARIISDGGYLSNAYIKGYSSNYFQWMQQSVEWLDGGGLFDNQGQAVIEKSVASDLSVRAGERVMVEYRTAEGAINTASYEISGIFIGNKYEHANAIFVLLEDAQNLGMVEDNKINRLKIYLRKSNDIALLQRLVDKELINYTKIAHISVWRFEPGKNMFYRIFQYSQMFIKILIILVSVVLLIVLFFGIQNVFYLTFNERANEISVLATYGMPFLKIYKMVFWETVILFTASIMSGLLLSVVIGKVLSGIKMAHISDEMVLVLGGPNLQFDFIFKDFTWIALFLLAVGIYSSLHSLRKYFKMEVREMIGGIKA